MIQHLAFFTEDTIKLVDVNTDTKEVISVIVINKSIIGSIHFLNFKKEVTIILKDGEDIDYLNDYYEPLFNHYHPPIKWSDCN